MTKEFSPDRLDVKAFAQARTPVRARFAAEIRAPGAGGQGPAPDLRVDWTATGELRTELGDSGQVWLHLKVQATFPMECQRCLTPVDVPLDVERSFRFVADEATAEALDDESEEDLLALSREFDLRELIEDELLMALPVVPRHDECPTAVPLASSDDDFEAANAEKPNPFAALGWPAQRRKGTVNWCLGYNRGLHANPLVSFWADRVFTNPIQDQEPSWPFSKTKSPLPSAACTARTMP
jgi:uncharacterized protein